jgi:hypothetical protein
MLDIGICFCLPLQSQIERDMGKQSGNAKYEVKKPMALGICQKVVQASHLWRAMFFESLESNSFKSFSKDKKSRQMDLQHTH